MRARALWRPEHLERWGIRPWDMERFTRNELIALGDMVKRQNREAKRKRG